MHEYWDIIIKILGVFATATIAVIGWKLPRSAEHRRRQKFIELLGRELREMGPTAAEELPHGAPWPDLLVAKNKRFIHREIFTNPAESRDFILSLDADLAYEVTQMWSCFDMAAQMHLEPDYSAKLATPFRDYLGNVCLKIGLSPTLSPKDRSKLLGIEARWTAELQKRGIQLLPFRPPE